jgi:putative SOS response-associated peptidase YedK
MCVNYLAVQDARRYESAFGVGMPLGPWASELYPKSRGTFIRRRGEPIGLEREATGGTWGLLPRFAKTPEIKFNAVNARLETIATAPSYKTPWASGQRCIVPMDAFFEPNWETGRHIRWKFTRRDGAPIAVAGLWERWRGSHSQGEIISYTLLTVNADDHPLMRRMHKPGQEKRMLALLDPAEYDEWLGRPPGEAFELLRLYPPELLTAEAAPRSAAQDSSALKQMADTLRPDE